MPDLANASATGKTQQAPSPVQKRKVLVVDDYMMIRHNHRALLQKYGFEVLEASDGDEALRVVRKVGAANISLMIVDLVMPVMNGADFIKTCHSEFGKDVPQILVCSSVAELPIVKKIVELGIDGYLVKPIDYKLFIKKLGEMFPGAIAC